MVLRASSVGRKPVVTVPEGEVRRDSEGKGYFYKYTSSERAEKAKQLGIVLDVPEVVKEEVNSEEVVVPKKRGRKKKV